MQGALLGPFGRYALGREVVTLGRAPANTLVIDDSKASGRHAEVWPDGAGYMVVDVGSTNGTLLNGQPLRPQEPQPLRDGDVITIGLTRVTVEMTADQNAALVTEPLAASARAARQLNGSLRQTQEASRQPSRWLLPICQRTARLQRMRRRPRCPRRMYFRHHPKSAQPGNGFCLV